MIRPIVSPEQVLTDPDVARREYHSAATIAVDIETTGLRPGRDRVAVVSLAAPARPPAVLTCPDGQLPPWVVDLLSRPGAVVFGHNFAAFDLPFLVRAGLRLSPDVTYLDTLVLEQLCLVSGRRDLRKDLATAVRRRLGIELDKSVDHGTWDQPVLSPEQVLYCANDVALLHALLDRQLAVIRERAMDDALRLENSVVPVTASMVATGFPVLRDRLISMAMDRRRAAEDLSDRLAAFGVRNPRSAKQVLAAFSALGATVTRTDAETLDLLATVDTQVGELARLVAAARQDLKRDMYDEDWVAKYVDPDGRVRSRFWQLGTDSGRFSSSDPNLQQIPKDLRPAFGPDPDSGRVMVSIDYSQIEVLIAAALFDDPAFLEAVRSSDVHTTVASMLFRVPPSDVTKTQRTTAKAAVFTILFAGGPHGIERTAAALGLRYSTREARELLDAMYRTYPKVAACIDRVRRLVTAKRAAGHAYTVRIPGGPVRVLYGNQDLTASTVINTVIQGTAAVGLKRALRRVWESFPDFLVLCVHDELVLEVPADRAQEVAATVSTIMADEMRRLIDLEPRTSVTIGPTWGKEN